MSELLVIENGRVFLNGKETNNPTEIGYAVLDIAENIEEQSNEGQIVNYFSIKELVYLIHDPEQLPRMIIGYKVDESGVVWVLSCGDTISEHYAFEMSKNKIVY